MPRPVQRKGASIALVLLLTVSATWLVAGDKRKKTTKTAAAASQMGERQQAMHALNRLTFGPRPGDVDRVMAMGVERWIDLQLNPNKIDDSALEARLSQYRTLKMNARELADNFPPPQVLKAVADGKMRMPNDPDRRAVYEAALDRYQNSQDKKGAAAEAQKQADQQNMNPDEMSAEQKQARREARLHSRQQADRLMAMSPDDRMNAILKMPPEERMEIVKGLNQQERMDLADGMSPKQKETLLALANTQAVVVGELMAAKLMRDVYSERQLDEVMTDFWFNHFNVFIGKGPERYLLNDYERDVIRPNALGKFKDLLMATAKSPAMLFYLDNWQSVGPSSPAANLRRAVANGEMPPPRGRRPGRFGYPYPRNPNTQARREQQMRKAARTAPKGLNENYAREIMELHTLGVNGGYTQRDVTELAKILTGWTIKQPQQGGGFEFNERVHEPGTKYFLGQKFREDGEKEGERAIEILARNPSTARFISRKLAIRFVSDNPPDALVNRMAETFQKSDGDIKAVLRTMFRSPEFWAPEAYRAKVKTPLEFVVSSLRATGADVQFAGPLIQQMNKMGMPLYGAQPPTGYSMKAETWVNSAALLDRMNFSLALGTGRLPGMKVDPDHLGAPVASEQPEVVQANLEQILLGGDVSKQTHDTIAKRLSDPQVTGRELDDAPRPVNAGVIAGLLLGSPEFQKR
jgi:uncharacterized protein (DUF1800 family)